MPLNGQKRPNIRSRCWSVARVVKSEKDTATALSNYTEEEKGGRGEGGQESFSYTGKSGKIPA